MDAVSRKSREEQNETQFSLFMRNYVIPYGPWVFAGLFVHIYFIFALIYSVKGATFPIVVFSLGYLYVAYAYLLPYVYERFLEPKVAKIPVNFKEKRKKLENYLEWQIGGFKVVNLLFTAVLLSAFAVWIILDSKNSRIRLRSVAGILMYIVISVMISANPAKIKWRPVIGGIILQFVFGLLVLRWQTGHDALRWASEQVVYFLDYTMVGAAFTYGFIANPPNICGFGSVFLYTSLQIIIYFGAIVAVLYYLGIIEFVLSRIAIVMHYTVGTTAAESLNAAACIFLGQTEAAILIEPALSTMTESEIHSVMTAGFACIAGSLFSAYISFGACPTYLLSATVMSAAVSLAVSKIIYPEIQESRQKDMKSFQFKSRSNVSLLGCISQGAVHSASFVGAIGANLIVYLAILAFINEFLGYLGSCVGYPELTFNQILGYCFFPLAYMMGASDAEDSATNIDETMKVAELMGMKTVLNEFIAYQRLAQMMSDGTLKGVRARMIATYALCGFSNISMIGSQLGILGSMCPQRRGIFAKLVIRALMAGCISCFLTACVAGVLIETPIPCYATVNANCVDLSKIHRLRNSTL